MFQVLFQGLLFGLAYVAPIGTQNLYVINTATTQSRMKAYQVALITVIFDISLAIACFFGIGLLIEEFDIVKKAILLLGGAIVTYIGIGLIRSTAKLTTSDTVDTTLIKTILSCFAVTWLNPQAIIDGSLLLGGFRATLDADMAKYFIMGVCMASFTWFFTLATFITRFKEKMPRIIKWINLICGSILVFYGLKLMFSFVQLMNWF